MLDLEKKEYLKLLDKKERVKRYLNSPKMTWKQFVFWSVDKSMDGLENENKDK